MPPTLRPLGSSGLVVPALSLGSWRTFERIPRTEGVAVLRRALELGITFLDDARYNDETGTAPMPSGYSEVVFGELLRATAWPRDQVLVANKLWWEYWPGQSAQVELDGSLARMGLDHVDLLYAAPPPPELPVDEVVGLLGQLIASGRARAWGVLNWPAPLLADAVTRARQAGVPAPCAAQLPYNLLRRSPVEDDDMIEALTGIEIGGERGWQVGVVASAVLAGGALSGKYDEGEGDTPGRLSGWLDQPEVHQAVRAASRLTALAHDLDTTPAAAAIAFALWNPLVSTALFGATSVAQVEENVGALALIDRLDHFHLTELRQQVA